MLRISSTIEEEQTPRQPGDTACIVSGYRLGRAESLEDHREGCRLGSDQNAEVSLESQSEESGMPWRAMMQPSLFGFSHEFLQLDVLWKESSLELIARLK